jgi:hypothetical protein
MHIIVTRATQLHVGTTSLALMEAPDRVRVKALADDTTDHNKRQRRQRKHWHDGVKMTTGMNNDQRRAEHSSDLMQEERPGRPSARGSSTFPNRVDKDEQNECQTCPAYDMGGLRVTETPLVFFREQKLDAKSAHDNSSNSRKDEQSALTRVRHGLFWLCDAAEKASGLMQLSFSLLFSFGMPGVQHCNGALKNLVTFFRRQVFFLKDRQNLERDVELLCLVQHGVRLSAPVIVLLVCSMCQHPHVRHDIPALFVRQRVPPRRHRRIRLTLMDRSQ